MQLIIPTMVGLLAGMLAVAWVRPNTSSGAVLLVVVVLLISNLVSLLVALVRRRS